MEWRLDKVAPAAPSPRSLSVTPGGCWKRSMTGACSALTILDCSMVLYTEVCCAVLWLRSWLSSARLRARTMGKGEGGMGQQEQQQAHLEEGQLHPLSLVLRISSKRPMAREQAVSPLTSVAPTLALNTASSPGLDSADAGALPGCERRGCELPSRLFGAFPPAAKRSICPVCLLLPSLQPGFLARARLL